MIGLVIVVLVILTFYILTGKNVMAILAGIVAIPFVLMAKKYHAAGGDDKDAISYYMNENESNEISGGYECDESLMKLEYNGGGKRKSIKNRKGGRKGTKDASDEGNAGEHKEFDPTRQKVGLQGWFRGFVGDAVTKEGKNLAEMDILEVGARGGVNAFNLAEQVKSWTILTGEKRAEELKKFKKDYANVNLEVGGVNDIPASIKKKKYDLIYFDNNLHHSEDLDALKEALKGMTKDTTLFLVAEPTKENPGKHPKFDPNSDQYLPDELTAKIRKIEKADEFIKKNFEIVATGKRSGTWILKLK